MTAIDQAQFRSVMGQVPTCVTVVTAQNQAPIGIVIGSFVSISLDPPLVGLFVAKTSRAWAAMRDVPALCINVLAADQADVSGAFMRDPAERFDGIDCSIDENGAPVVAGTAATISGKVVSITDAGDHDFVLCEVVAMSAPDPAREPLIFHGGKYRTLEA